MDRDFDKYLDTLSQPLVDAPKYEPAPEAIPMEKTVLVDLASAVDNKRTHEGTSAEREARRQEGLVAPPLDVYEPSFRTDLTAAIKSFWKEQRKIRDNNDRIRKITGIGRTI